MCSKKVKEEGRETIRSIVNGLCFPLLNAGQLLGKTRVNTTYKCMTLLYYIYAQLRMRGSMNMCMHVIYTYVIKGSFHMRQDISACQKVG